MCPKTCESIVLYIFAQVCVIGQSLIVDDIRVTSLIVIPIVDLLSDDDSGSVTL